MLAHSDHMPNGSGFSMINARSPETTYDITAYHSPILPEQIGQCPLRELV